MLRKYVWKKGDKIMWKKIEEIMQEKEMSQYKLAKKMNVHSSVITELKKGRIEKPSFELACKFADALGISVDDLRNDKK
ncbi:helix-turn-helix transcriptional regulator [Enterococcus faecalis]|nr:helix-turn-helix transcriptional regulator [Enterococcus faecalis]